MARSTDVMEFSEIRITFPRGMIRRCFWKEGHLSIEETRKLRQKSAEIKRLLPMLQHADSVVDKCLLKGDGNRGDS